MKKKFNFPVLVLNGAVEIIPKREPIFCFKDENRDGRYEIWKSRCKFERKANQRPVSAKERAEQSEVQ